jgi:hypothetical protein
MFGYILGYEERVVCVYIHYCNVKYRKGVVWFRLGIWRRRGTERIVGQRRCPLRKEEDNEILKCKEAHSWREKVVNNSCIHTNEEIA